MVNIVNSIFKALFEDSNVVLFHLFLLNMANGNAHLVYL